MKLYDATLTIHEEMPVFPGDPPFKTKPVSRIGTGDGFNLSTITMGTHLGTHVDPPAHFIDNGATVDQIALKTLVGPGVVADLRGCAQIDRQVLVQAALVDCKRILLKTDNGALLAGPSFQSAGVYLTEDGARYLVDSGARLVGIDCLSIENPDSPGSPVHRLLLEAGVLVVEGVHLVDIPAGDYEIFCLPLKIKGADGAPARVILRG